MAIRIAAVVVGLLIVGGVLGLLASSDPLSTAVPAGPEPNTSPAALTPTQASSSQGDLLTRHGLVVPRATASFDAHEVGSPSVMLDGDTYKMWYHASDGGTWRIAYATSSDGRAWSLHGPVLSPSLAAEGFVLAYGEVVRLRSELWMWYTGSDWNSGYARVFLATSPDGTTWTKRGVALDVGPSGSLDDRFVYDPSVQIRDGTFYMWYTGLSWAEFRPRIFLATSPDGLEWTKHGVVMSEGEAGSLDGGWSYAASVRFIAGRYHMIYTGAPGDFSADRLFFAESADGRTWTNRRLALDVLGPEESPRMGFPALLLEPNGQWAVYYAARGVQQQVFLATRAPLGYGLLRATTAIDLHPDAGVPGKILVDGIPRDEWGLTWLKVSPGEHRISFTDIPGLGTPDEVVANVTPGQVLNVTGTYPAYGFLRVTTEPAVPATIGVNGVARNDWGLWMAVPPGAYEISFGAVDGYRPPRTQTATVVAEETTHVVGEYRATPGTRGPDPSTYGLLRVVTALNDRRFGVPSQVLVDGVPMDEWGLTWVKLALGVHIVEFTDVPSLGTPAPQRIEVVAGQAAEVTGVFEVHGFLRVRTDPALAATISVDRIARNDWGMWQSMPPGTYTVSFEALEGYTQPATQTVTVYPDRVTEVVGHYRVPQLDQSWARYAANPVLTPGPPGSWDNQSVVLGSVVAVNGTFHLYYGGTADGSRTDIGHATSPDGVNWTKNGSNPVLTRASGTWDAWAVYGPVVLQDEGVYKMWYTALEGDGFPGSIGYATSRDGSTWDRHAGNPVLERGPGWDGYTITTGDVIRDATGYRMWYSGTADGLSWSAGLALSLDGINWTKYSGNPIITPPFSGGWDRYRVHPTSVLPMDTGFIMWYVGAEPDLTQRVGSAVSRDGIAWMTGTSPVLDLGPPGSWDSVSLSRPTVVAIGDEWWMWYTANDGARWHIGFARAPLAVPGEPTLSRQGLVLGWGAPGEFDSDELGASSVLFDDGRYKMWYFGRSSGIARIGFATSPDGRAWTKHGPVLAASLPAEAGNVLLYPEVLKIGEEFRMWYSAWDGLYLRILEARSPDGVNWTKLGVVLDIGPPGSPEDFYVFDATVVVRNGRYSMWYSATSFADPRRTLFLATSEDGSNWTKRGQVLPLGPTGALDEDGAFGATVRFLNGRYEMVYSGERDASRLMFAESDDGFQWRKMGLALDILLPNEGGLAQPGFLVEADGTWLVYYMARPSAAVFPGFQIFLATKSP